MRIAPYCRVSTDKTDQLNSLEMQKKFYGEFAEKNGHKITEMYADCLLYTSTKRYFPRSLLHSRLPEIYSYPK